MYYSICYWHGHAQIFFLMTVMEWNNSQFSSELRLGSNITRNSQCELEVDVNADDILNQLEIQGL